MKFKKLTSLALAGVMTFALAAPAFAGTETTITGTYSEIKIDVDVPQAVDAVINPYGMPVKAKYVPLKADGSVDTENIEDVDTLGTAGKIATQPIALINRTQFELAVGATITATAKGPELVTSIPAGSTDKLAQIYLECTSNNTIVEADLSDTASDKPISNVKGARIVAEFNNWAATTYSASNESQLLIDPDADVITSECLAVMAPANGGTDEDEVKAGSVVLARLGGDVVRNPDTAWKAGDTVTVKIAWSFAPPVYEEKTGGDITIGAITTSMTSSTNSVSATVAPPTGVTFSGSETYSWSVSNSKVKIKSGDETAASPKVYANSGSSAGDKAILTVVVTDGLVIYTSTKEIAIVAP